MRYIIIGEILVDNYMGIEYTGLSMNTMKGIVNGDLDIDFKGNSVLITKVKVAKYKPHNKPKQ